MQKDDETLRVYAHNCFYTLGNNGLAGANWRKIFAKMALVLDTYTARGYQNRKNPKQQKNQPSQMLFTFQKILWHVWNERREEVYECIPDVAGGAQLRDLLEQVRCTINGKCTLAKLSAQARKKKSSSAVLPTPKEAPKPTNGYTEEVIANTITTQVTNPTPTALVDKAPAPTEVAKAIPSESIPPVAEAAKPDNLKTETSAAEAAVQKMELKNKKTAASYMKILEKLRQRQGLAQTNATAATTTVTTPATITPATTAPAELAETTTPAGEAVQAEAPVATLAADSAPAAAVDTTEPSPEQQAATQISLLRQRLMKLKVNKA